MGRYLRGDPVASYRELQVEKGNPDWKDLYDELINVTGFPPSRE
jgi:hypothetical protein